MSDILWPESRIRALLDLDTESRISVAAALAICLEMAQEYEAARVADAQFNAEARTMLSGIIEGLEWTIVGLKRDFATIEKTLTDERDDLQRQLAHATRPAADVYVTIDTTRTVVCQLQQGLAIVTNEFLKTSAAAAVERLAAHVNALYEMVSYHLSGGFGVNDFWRWNPAEGPRPPQPTNTATLTAMANLAARFGKPHLLTVYRPSWHLKRERERALTYAEAFGQETGRLAGEARDDWRLMVAEMFVTAATEILAVDPEATIYCQIHNEFKGMWELLDRDGVVAAQNWADGDNPGTPGFGDIDYGPYYALSIEGVREGMARLELAEGRVKFGGPYAVMQSEYMRDADAVPLGHPLAERKWGSSGKQAPLAVERFIAYVKANQLPLDFLVIDGGTRNKDEIYGTDAFGQLTKLGDCTRYVRSLLDAAGYNDTPIWWAERYLTERPHAWASVITPEQDSMARRVVVTLAGLCELAWAGAGVCCQWGLRGEDGDPVLDKENAAQFAADGTPTALYDALLEFKDTFPVGARLHPLIFEGEGVGGLASDEACLLLNKTATPRTVAFGQKVFVLAGDGREVVIL